MTDTHKVALTQRKSLFLRLGLLETNKCWSELSWWNLLPLTLCSKGKEVSEVEVSGLVDPPASQLWWKSDPLKFPVVCVMTGRLELLHLTDCWISQSPNHYWEVHTTWLNITDEKGLFLSQWFFFPACLLHVWRSVQRESLLCCFLLLHKVKSVRLWDQDEFALSSLFPLCCAVSFCCWNFLQSQHNETDQDPQRKNKKAEQSRVFTLDYL